jgi:hypothetical protein
MARVTERLRDASYVITSAVMSKCERAKDLRVKRTGSTYEYMSRAALRQANIGLYAPKYGKGTGMWRKGH